MITTEKVNVYQRLNNDIHNWGEFGSALDKSVMDDEDWSTIDELIQDLSLNKTGLASDAFMKSVNERLDEFCADNYAIQALKRIA